MNRDLATDPLADVTLFGPVFLVFAALLIGLYVFIAPPDGNVVRALVTSLTWGLVDPDQFGF